MCPTSLDISSSLAGVDFSPSKFGTSVSGAAMFSFNLLCTSFPSRDLARVGWEAYPINQG